MSAEDVPVPEVTGPNQSPWRNLSLVWLVPIAAIVISLGIAWSSFSNRGTLVTISFQTAAGVIAGETTLKFRDVVIGTVESVRFSQDMAKVIVSARIDNDVASSIPPDAEFWVVAPVVNTRGISGLSTVLSGVYIEGAWLPNSAPAARDFEGLAAAPMVRPGREGVRITIRSENGTRLPEGAPVFYRGVEVGRLDTPRLSPSGDSALVEAFVNAPYDRYLSSASRFWDTSGFSVSIGTGGVDLSVASIGSLLNGGVSFDTVVADGSPITDQTVFDLYADEATAKQSVFAPVSKDALSLAILFSGSVSGLEVGAPVQYRGLPVGKVTRIGAFMDNAPGGRTVRMRAMVDIDPQALGLNGTQGATEALAFLKDAVAGGMRARLASANIFSAALKVDLAELTDQPPATVATDAEGVPVLPSVTSDLPQFTATAEGVLERINALPIEDVMNQAISLMASIEAVATAESTRAVPEKLAGLLDDAQRFVAQDDTRALPGELRAAVAELRAMVADLNNRQTAEKLAGVLDTVNRAADGFAAASQDFPALVADLRALADKAQALKAEELIDRTTQLVQSADAVIATDAARALPADLSATLVELRRALQELREGGTVENANQTLASARKAADSVAVAADSLPELAKRLQDVLAKADALVATYGARSDFNAQTLDVLREIQAAARSVARLAGAIERKPNSLLLGR